MCALTFLVFATAETSVASVCVSELDEIVKTAQGRATGPGGEPIKNAQVTVTSPTDDVIFQTRSEQDGSFRLATKPGKYRVEIEAEGYLRFIYIVDLRSTSAKVPRDLFLQTSSGCNDFHVVSSPDIQGKEGKECSSEVLAPNLTLGKATIISGQVRDDTGAPFRDSKIVLRKLSDSPLQPSYLDVKTDARGTFSFDEAEPGKYRLLATPSRAFAQPAKLDCYEEPDCNLEIVLKANGTDLPYVGCPVR
jgi:hypothetical protein